jgi:hypothetical protein
MEKNPLSKGVLTENFVGIGAVSRAMVHARARELALIAGHVPPHVTQADYEQAKRELLGKTDIDRQEAQLDALPETKRWDPVPGSTGHQAPESPSEDEDEDGLSETAQLTAEGVGEAEHDQMLQAARAAERADRAEAQSTPPAPEVPPATEKPRYIGKL